MALSLALTATPEGLWVRQYPPSLRVMRGETATLSCHFKVESLKYGVQWFKMKSKKQLIPESSGRIVVVKNQTSSLVITEVAQEDSGWYYCEVNVLQKDPEWGNGTELIVLGEGPVALFRNSFVLLCLGYVAMLVIKSHLCPDFTRATAFSARQLNTGASVDHASPEKKGPGSIYKNSSHVKFPQSSSFCLNSFMTDLEIITAAPCAVPRIDLAQGIETHQKTRQGGMVKLLCGNPSCGRKASFWFSLDAKLPPVNNNWYFMFI